MKEVVRVTRPSPDRSAADAKIADATRDLAFMQLARIHYGARQNRYALYYYGKIERGKPEWLEALFESSWANYRIGQYEQALGNLITLSSPFFRDEYFPEALILKAVIYYENCRYAESTAIVQEFERRYKPVYDALDDLTRKNMEAADVLRSPRRDPAEEPHGEEDRPGSGPDPRAGAEARPERQGPQEHQRLDHRAGERARRG